MTVTETSTQTMIMQQVGSYRHICTCTGPHNTDETYCYQFRSRAHVSPQHRFLSSHPFRLTRSFFSLYYGLFFIDLCLNFIIFFGVNIRDLWAVWYVFRVFFWCYGVTLSRIFLISVKFYFVGFFFVIRGFQFLCSG